MNREQPSVGQELAPLNDRELIQVEGGVTADEQGRSCTEHGKLPWPPKVLPFPSNTHGKGILAS